MRSAPRRPTPEQLSRTPELAALAALDLVLELAVSSLPARHQDIGADVPHHPLTTLVCHIIESADGLRLLIRRYRAALARHRRNIPI